MFANLMYWVVVLVACAATISMFMVVFRPDIHRADMAEVLSEETGRAVSIHDPHLIQQCAELRNLTIGIALFLWAIVAATT